MRFQTDLFNYVIEIYRKSTKERHLPPDFDIRKAHNWDEVYAIAKLAKDKAKKHGVRSIFSKIGRGIERSSPAVEPWLGLIPNGNYTSALYGGLKIAFGVCSRKITMQPLHILGCFRSQIVYKHEETKSSKRFKRPPQSLGSPKTVWGSGRMTRLLTKQLLSCILLS